jgi:pimeloyl-ACP methyl ester carboxylesterase
MKSLDNTQFTTSVTETLGRAGLYKGQTLVFVHGYNVDFEEAVKRAAQIAFDLEFDGLIVAFAWPSQRRLTQYLSDTASADVAVDFLIKFVDMLAERLPGAKVHFIAHSMGNVVLLRALERIAERRGAGPQTSLGELILAHADVEGTRCAQLIRNVRPAVAGITLYVNTSDWALWASEKLSTKGRCGAMARVYEGADTIDTTGLNAMGDRWPADSIFLPVLKNLVAVRTEGLNHDAFVRVPLLFGEITRLLLTGMRPPDKRTTDLAQVKNNEGKIYWRFDKARLVAQMPAADKVLETGADPTTK